AGEADHGVHAETRGGPGGQLHLLGGARPDALGFAVAPDPVREDVAVSLVQRVVTDRLALEVVGDGPDTQAVALQDVPPGLEVGVVLCGAPDVEVVAPAGDLQTVV